jgi:signal peptidase I
VAVATVAICLRGDRPCSLGCDSRRDFCCGRRISIQDKSREPLSRLVETLAGVSRDPRGFGMREDFVGPLHWQTFSIPRSSMEPTSLVGDLIFVVDNYYQAHTPQRGDIAVFNLPCDFPNLDPANAAVYRRNCNTSVDFIKRISGVPGDRIQLKHGVLFINDGPVRRESAGPYIFTGDLRPKTFQEYREILGSGYTYDVVLSGDDGELENTDLVTMPAGRYFVLGDSRDNSADSRDTAAGVGFVPQENLFARPAFVLFSTDGSARWWQVWKWPTAIRWRRFGLSLQ